MRVLVFGDSITQGFWDTDGGWVNRLRKKYAEQQLADLRSRDEPSIFNLGVSADTTENILKRIVAETVVRTNHNNLPIIIVQIGVNDSCTLDGYNQVDLDTYIKNLKEIINTTKPITSKIIFVGLSACIESETTPVFWRDIHYTNANIKKYEDAMKDTANELSIPFIPVFNKFTDSLENNKYLLADGLLPTNKGHQVIADILLPDLENLLH